MYYVKIYDIIFLCFWILVERSKASKFMSSNITTNVTSWATIDLLPDGKCCLVKVIACNLHIIMLSTITGPNWTIYWTL